jgi:hypothetical protein
MGGSFEYDANCEPNVANGWTRCPTCLKLEEREDEYDTDCFFTCDLCERELCEGCVGTNVGAICEACAHRCVDYCVSKGVFNE